jgi:hypothetical protein
MTKEQSEEYNLLLRLSKAFTESFAFIRDEQFSWAELEIIPYEISDNAEQNQTSKP